MKPLLKHFAVLFVIAFAVCFSTGGRIASASTFSKITNGEDLIRAMHDKYAGKWYKTLTFSQKTTNYKPDGTSETSQWYEALNAPGKLRIDFEPLDKRDGALFADGQIYSWHDGKPNPGRPYVHPLLVLGFDVYVQPVETTIAQLKDPKSLGIDLATLHEENWQGQDVYVVGAKAGDLKTPQFWVTKKDLLFVRLIQLAGRDKKSVQETQFNKYQKATGGGWVSAEVKFFTDGKPATTEEYTNIKTGMTLNPDLWNPDKWATVDQNYWH